MAAGLGLIPDALAERCRDAYREFRRLQHALRLNGAQYARVPRGAGREPGRGRARAVGRGIHLPSCLISGESVSSSPSASFLRATAASFS